MNCTSEQRYTHIVYIYIYTLAHTYTKSQTHTNTNTYTCIYTYICTHIHTHTHTRTHTLTHTYTPYIEAIHFTLWYNNTTKKNISELIMKNHLCIKLFVSNHKTQLNSLTHIYTHTKINADTHTHTFIRAHTHTHKHIRVWIHVDTHTRMKACPWYVTELYLMVELQF